MEKIHYSRREYREEYLQSEEWKLLGAAILLRDPICRICDDSPSVDPHHLSYERLHHELPEDLAGLCRKCHRFIHRHKELAKISDIVKLKATVKLARIPQFIEGEFLSQILNSIGNVRSSIAGILKLPSSRFEKLDGKKIDFFKKKKIEIILDSCRTFNREKPRRHFKYGSARNPIRI